MQSVINREHIEGRIYEHSLVQKTVQNPTSANFGKNFISGSIEVATDEAGLNVISVHYTYVPEFTKAGGKSQTYLTLQKIIEEGQTWIMNGPEAATKVKMDPKLALNDFYGQDGSLVSVKRNEGGFISIVNELDEDESRRNTFTVDMILTSITTVETNEERGITEPYMVLKGAIFNDYSKALLPLDFVVKNPQGMAYFDKIDVSNSNPIFTKVWGRIVSATSYIERTEESAFGEAAVKRFERKTKEWTVTGTAKVPYEFGEEGVLTVDELTKAMQDREVYLAGLKQRDDEYRANRTVVANQAMASGNASSLPAGAVPTAKQGTFNF